MTERGENKMIEIKNFDGAIIAINATEEELFKDDLEEKKVVKPCPFVILQMTDMIDFP
jgi:hypothetical protein